MTQKHHAWLISHTNKCTWLIQLIHMTRLFPTYLCVAFEREEHSIVQLSICCVCANLLRWMRYLLLLLLLFVTIPSHERSSCSWIWNSIWSFIFTLIMALQIICDNNEKSCPKLVYGYPHSVSSKKKKVALQALIQCANDFFLFFLDNDGIFFLHICVI